MSLCGCIGQIAPGTSRSSLKTRSVPNRMYAGSWYVSNEKCQRARNHPPSTSEISPSRRIVIVIAPRASARGSQLDNRTGERAGDAVQLLHRHHRSLGQPVEVVGLRSRDHVVGTRDRVDGDDAVDPTDVLRHLRGLADLRLDEDVRADHSDPPMSGRHPCSRGGPSPCRRALPRTLWPCPSLDRPSRLRCPRPPWPCPSLDRPSRPRCPRPPWPCPSQGRPSRPRCPRPPWPCPSQDRPSRPRCRRPPWPSRRGPRRAPP